MNKKLFSLAFILCFAIHSFGQIDPSTALSMPNIIPPSPEAAELGKYGQIPVDLSSGIPSIDIPIYMIKTPRFQLPISLSYHASGVKVDEIAPWTGLGWSLNAGGLITRTVVGLNDDDYYGYLYYNIPQPGDLQTPTANQYMDGVIRGQRDSEPDNFYYNFTGHSGKFFIGDNKKPIQVPITPIQIQMPDSTAQPTIQIKDEHGNLYIFGTYEYVTTGSHPTSITHYCISSWYLSQMISADHSDTVKFNYNTETNQQYEYSYTFTQTLGDVYAGNGGICTDNGTQQSGITEVTGYRVHNPVRISSITYNGGKVTFISKSGRQDSPTSSLDSIIVYNYDFNAKVYNRIKSAKLNMDYFPAVATTSDPINSLGTEAWYRLKLTGVTESDMNNSPVQNYQFGYNSTLLPPVNDFSQDIYGFYNGKITNQSLLLQQIGTPPTNTVQYTIGNADRSTSPDHMMAGMLQTIQYPTGGYTNFVYEPARSSVGIGGGIRISAIKNYNSNNQLLSTKTYKYGANESGLGVLISTPDAIIPAQFNQTYFSSTTNSGATEGVTDCQYFLRVFNSSSKYALSTLSGSPIVYPTVTEYTGNSLQNIGKTIHQYDTCSDRHFQCSIYYLNGLMLTPYSWRNGQENYEAYYKATGSGQYALVSDKRTSYINVDSIQARGMKIGYTAVFPTSWYYTPASYYEFNYPIITGAKLPQQTIETAYDNTGLNVLEQKTTTYYYDNLVHLQPTRITTTSSEGDALQTTLRYPQDMVNGGNDPTGVYVGMTNANVISPVIESINLKNTVQLTDTKTNYFVYNNMFEPQTVQFSKGANSPDIRLNYQQYDNNGNLLTVSKQSGPPVSYQWGYNHAYPVAQVVNAANTSVATTSPVTRNGYLNAAAGQSSTFTTYTTGNITIAIQTTGAPNDPFIISFTLNGTGYALCFPFNNSSYCGPSEPSTMTLANMPAGSYTLNISSVTVPSGGSVPAELSISYIGSQTSYTGSNGFFYEGFEDGNGNSAQGYAKTGNYSHNGNYLHTINGLNNGNYTLSYWQNTGSGWTFQSSVVPVTGGSYQINLGVNIDDVRFYPVGALMKTYTYQPLVGATSASDEKSEITSYEYDSFQRLRNIKNDNGNIVKSLSYNYIGPQPSPKADINYFSSVESENFIRNNCTSGYSGTSIVYTEPEGAFSSMKSQYAADSLCLAVFYTNGQAYANANCSCTLNVSFTMSNSTGVLGYQLQFTGTSNFSVNIPQSGSSVINVPAGTYTVTVVPSGSTANHTYTLGTRASIVGASAIFGSVNISTGSSDLTFSMN
jgi:hypothetical protein